MSGEFFDAVLLDRFYEKMGNNRPHVFVRSKYTTFKLYSSRSSSVCQQNFFRRATISQLVSYQVWSFLADSDYMVN
jgi:hypothetical protein